MSSLRGSPTPLGHPCPLLPEAGCCRTRGRTGESRLESKKCCASAHHSWVWILVLATPGCVLDAPELGLLCGEELTISTQLELWGQTPFRSNRPSVEELHQKSASFQPTVLASPPPRLTNPGEKEPSPRPAETPWACSVWPHLPSSPSLLPPASTNSAASLCGRL